MFEKLVVSTRERHSSRTARFFFGTSIIYLTGLALAFIISVLVAAPKLADTNSRIGTLIAPLPPASGQRTSASYGQQQSAPRPGIYRPAPLDQINRTLNAPPTIVNLNLPPSIGPIGDGPGTREGTGNDKVFDGAIGIGRGIGEPSTELPPRPVEPPASKPQTVDRKSPLRVSTTVLQGKAIDRVTPVYPALALPIRLQGTISVEVIISPEGRVESARAINGHPILMGAAVKAARGWRFQPTLLNNTPVRVTGVITFIFKME